MASYQDLTFNNGDYVPQYAGAPLQEIADTASELSNRHYSNLARLNQLQLLREQAKSKVLPGAKGYIDTQFGDIDQALQDIAKSGGENSTAKISAIANRFLGDQGVLRATETAGEYQKFLDTQRQLKASGKSPIHNKALEQQYLNTPVVDEKGQMSSLYNDPFKLTTEPYIEPVPEIDKLWDVIKPDAFESILGTRDYLSLSKLIPQAVENGAIDMPMFYEMAKRSGISPDKIKKFTESVKRQVDSSDLGRQVRDYETLSPQQLDDLILQRGLMRVYSNTDRQVVQSGITDDLLRGNKPVVGAGVRSPLPAAVRQKFDPGFTTSQIDQYGNTQPSLVESFLTKTGTYTPEALRTDAKNLREHAKNAPNEKAKAIALSKAASLEAQASEQEADLGKFTKEKTDNMLSYMRTAMEVAGQNTEGLDDKQIQSIAANPNGQKLLKDYLDNYAGLRYHSPYINNIIDEKMRQANEDFLRGNFSQREFIDASTGEHYGGLKDSNGDVYPELLDLSKALQTKKAIVEGTVDPKHIYTQIPSKGDNFVRALRVQVPVGEGGEMKEFLVSQPTETTSSVDVNENLLYNAATEAPGRWSEAGNDIKVISPASPQQKEILWSKYGNASGLMKEQFMGNDIVILNVKGEDLIFPNYTVAAQYLAENKGIKLAKQKKK